VAYGIPAVPGRMVEDLDVERSLNIARTGFESNPSPIGHAG
jgi:hypothetical protein